ncbi:hypothetical protein [Levilactobacillus mulengensis]|uniref:hypothetical protein n=1 Tax=Levilactobacillus mulengensis TaxID=2486025 RepID=UPI000F7A81BC|nr:hypothetical protein [Levilactobacillus mulengensis]
MRKVTKLMAAGLIAATVGAGMPGIPAQAAYKPIPKSLRGTWKTKGTAKNRRTLHVTTSKIYATIYHKYGKYWQNFDLGLAQAHLVKSSKNTYSIKGIFVNSGKSGTMPGYIIHVKKKGKLVGVKGIDAQSVAHKYVWYHK